MDDYLFLFFSPSDTSRAAGRDFWRRRHLRTADVDPPSPTQTALAQRAALVEWNSPRGERFGELKEIGQPTLVVNGNHDIMMPTINSYILAQSTDETPPVAQRSSTPSPPREARPASWQPTSPTRTNSPPSPRRSVPSTSW
jgi:pimeloyl-ACP methyl ester carboxylesterase